MYKCLRSKIVGLLFGYARLVTGVIRSQRRRMCKAVYYVYRQTDTSGGQNNDHDDIAVLGVFCQC